MVKLTKNVDYNLLLCTASAAAAAVDAALFIHSTQFST